MVQVRNSPDLVVLRECFAAMLSQHPYQSRQDYHDDYAQFIKLRQSEQSAHLCLESFLNVEDYDHSQPLSTLSRCRTTIFWKGGINVLRSHVDPMKASLCAYRSIGQLSKPDERILVLVPKGNHLWDGRRSRCLSLSHACFSLSRL